MEITIIRVADLNLAVVKADCQNNYQITKFPAVFMLTEGKLKMILTLHGFLVKVVTLYIKKP